MSYRLLIGIVAVCIQLCRASVSSTSCERACEVKVTLDSGPVCGRVMLAENDTEYYRFLGIPYAKPPVGSRRFLAPESPDPWDEPLDATVEGPACLQKDIFYGRLPVQIRGQSEDCLYANVYIPASADLSGESTGLSILVFVHGGGFNAGSGNSDINGPDYLVRKGVIVVTFNYRLGVFGFLSLNTTEVPGNAGLRDILEVLNWVKRNARAFGGNPDDVTLMGQSAGATNVHLLSLSDASQGLFNKIILLSGTAIPSFFSASPSYSQYANQLLLSYLGINSTDTAVVYEQLLNTPPNKLMYASEQLQYVTGLCTFVPTVEDASLGITRILEDNPINLIGEGRGNDYPTLLSFTSDEAQTFLYTFLVFNFTGRFVQNPEVMLSPRLLYSLPSDKLTTLGENLRQRYFEDTEDTNKLLEGFTDSYFKYVVLKLAQWRALQSGAPLYLHEYGYNSDFSPIKEGLGIDFQGAGHAEDLMNIFRVTSILQKYISYPPKTKDDEMKEWMTNIVSNFTSCSNPTCIDDDVSPWPPVCRDSLQYQYTNTSSYNLRELTTEQIDMVEFFDSIDEETRVMTEKLSK